MQQEKLIYLIRHGQTEFNRLGMIQGQGIDQSLNETGVRQAQLFFEKYQHIPFDLVFHSTLKRTVETVDSFLAKSIPFISTPDLNEISWGVYEGRTRDEEIRVLFTRLVQEWRRENYDFSWEGGESANDLDRRVTRFLTQLALRPEKTILVCSHGRTIRCILTRMLQLPLYEMERFEHENTGLFLLKYKLKQFSIIKQNDISHLEMASL